VLVVVAMISTDAAIISLNLNATSVPHTRRTNDVKSRAVRVVTMARVLWERYVHLAVRHVIHIFLEIIIVVNDVVCLNWILNWF